MYTKPYKYISFTSVAALIVMMTAATILEKLKGTEYGLTCKVPCLI